MVIAWLLRSSSNYTASNLYLPFHSKNARGRLYIFVQRGCEGLLCSAERLSHLYVQVSQSSNFDKYLTFPSVSDIFFSKERLLGETIPHYRGPVTKSTSFPGGGKMRDPGNEVAIYLREVFYAETSNIFIHEVEITQI